MTCIWVSNGFLLSLIQWMIHLLINTHQRYFNSKSVMKNVIFTLGISRGFAFMEFYSSDDAAKWMAENRVRKLARQQQKN